ncbi:hypothetical protein [Rhodovulum euryhalinum]|uniref:AraC-like DNA-binding protein n=1 Tax=Rhodovulum euryhalinum TaxID=35805 RepID=A0A4V2SAG5_9RHOB|nr:hypothetical protein [Rhodovulum euryhalinum]TCO71560.1 hypothetical protein EV655_10652 [Rhodovulum euryhalinum]
MGDGGHAFLGIPVTLPVDTVEDAANRLDTVTRRFRFGDVALALGRTPLPELDELLGLVRVLVSELERGSPRVAQAASCLNWTRMLSEKLVEVLAAAEVLHLPAAVELRPAYRHVGNALDHMRAHFSEIETMVEVAEACGVSTRTLETAFRLVLGTRPHAVLTASGWRRRGAF